jgi:hypothetical protein
VLVAVVVISGVTGFRSSAAHVFRTNKRSVLHMEWEDAIGAQPPLGLWDPLGMLKDVDQARFDRLRYVETKHGRISMLAILGHMVTTGGYRLPGNIFPDVPFSAIRSGLAALDDLPIQTIIATVALIGLLEIGFGARQEEIEEAQLRACEKYWDDETIAWKVAIELNNGRAAQMGILGLMVHEKLDNNPYIINSLLGYYPIYFNSVAEVVGSLTDEESVPSIVEAAAASISEAAESIGIR